jgi:hypothetical protein
MEGTERTGRAGPGRWLGVVFRLLATLFFLLLIVALNRCAATTEPGTTVPTVEAASSYLEIQVLPDGARVLVDGLRSGATPLSLELPPAQYTIRVEADGYEPLTETVTLAPGGEAIVTGELVPLGPGVPPTVSPSPTPTAGTEVALPDLVIRSVRIELETGGACDYTTTQLGTRVVIENAGEADAGPFVVDVNGSQQSVDAGLAPGQTVSLWIAGYSYGGETTITVDVASQVEESNKENNTLSQMVPIPTLPPTCTPPATQAPADISTATPSPTSTSAPSPTPTPTSSPAGGNAVTVREGQITIATYPYADYLTEAWNRSFNVPYAILDWAAYDASNPAPSDVTYRTLEMENEYLKLTFLPDLGGRLYEVVFKPTGHRETYRNPVLKPTHWGPLEQGWWLAAGGIEWCLPVEEHGYEWGVPWLAQVARDDAGATVLLRDTTAEDRVRAEIAVRLEAGKGYFTIRPRLENPTSAPLDVKYWTNAMLAPGGRNAPSAGLRFVLPDAVTAVTVHSRGDEFLPGYDERLPWPVYEGVDLSLLGNWNRWLGFFEDPAVGPFVAVYDGDYDEGMVRVFPADRVRGVKGFAFGWQDPIPADAWTDDGSSYVEIHGGPAPTFDDSVTLPAGGHLQWTEAWYPVVGLGGLRYANGSAALNLAASASQVQVAFAVTQPWSGEAILLLDGQERWRQAVSLVPGQPFEESLPLGGDVPQSGRLMLRLEAPGGTMVAEYSADFDFR